MSVKSTAIYQGNLDCEITHEQSGSTIQTEAPLDNGGNGTKFSPTDLIAAGLGGCILTMIGAVAKRENLDIKGAKAEVTKEMSASPVRRIGKLTVTVTLPKGLQITDVQKRKFEASAKGCPVKASIHPDIELNMNFVY